MGKGIFRGLIGACFLLGALVFELHSDYIYAVVFLLVGLLFLYRSVLESR